jgi:16S rRNA (cytosine1402-N4)-methyltransferase
MEARVKPGMGEAEFHIPVLLLEAIKGLNVQSHHKYIDATIGGGGHTLEILKNGGQVLGIDCDPEAILAAEARIKKGAILKQGNFAHLTKIAQEANFGKVSGILFDLGVSTFQLKTERRGFSFNSDAVLDMRMDPSLEVTAADLVNGLTEKELYELFKKYSEEFHSRAIARALVCARSLRPIKTGNDLAKIICQVRGKRGRFDRTHPATRIFQALRIAVNDELNNLRLALPQALTLLEKEGRLVVISFHSLEDRIVKNTFKEEERKGTLIVLTKKPVRPSEEEIRINPRARSAKMRVAQKL